MVVAAVLLVGVTWSAGPAMLPMHTGRSFLDSTRLLLPKAEFGRRTDAAGCGTVSAPLGAFCNLSATICSAADGRYYANATAIGNLTARVVSVPQAGVFTDPTSAEADAFQRVLAVMEPNAGPASDQPCGCQLLFTTFYNGKNCTLVPRFCVLYKSAEDVLQSKPVFRAKVFRAATPNIVGESPGFSMLNQSTPSVEEAVATATADYKSKVPSFNQECPIFPIVMVPGYPSTTIKYSFSDSPPPPDHLLCPRDSHGWQTLFPPTKAQDYVLPACYDSVLKLVFNNTTKEFVPARNGVVTRIDGFGSFSSIPTFAGVVSYFVSGGWQVDKTLFGVPFDWRKPSMASEEMFSGMKELIENASAANNGQPVVLWSVSGGPQWALSFLHRMNSAWKQRYIAWFIAQSPVWGGVVTNVPAFVSGVSIPDGQGATLPAAFLKGFARAVPSALWLFPRAGNDSATSWTLSDVLISTPTRNYTAFDIDQLFHDIGGVDDQISVRQFLAADADLAQLDAPGVNTFVSYGKGIDTVVGASYDTSIRPGQKIGKASFILGSGDNTVPLRSSLRAQKWGSAPNMIGKKLIYNGYFKQPHAQCWPSGPEDSAPCFHDVMDALRED